MNTPVVTDGRAAGALLIAANPEWYRSHFTHDSERTWPETNCYFDLWIEILHSLGMDPLPAFACTLSADHDGLQWSFIKQPPEDLRRLYGLEVTEENVWLPLLETVESGPRRQVLHTVEVDSWWLPDTAGTSYRADHVKTTIVPTRVDREARVMWYLHNAGLFELRDDDFDGIFGISVGTAIALPPYVEQIRRFPDRANEDAFATLAREHLARRAPGNPVERLAAGVREAMDWLPEAGMAVFHPWAFATLRQCGATAELAADYAAYANDFFAGAGNAAIHFRDVASTAKSVQYRMARVAGGRQTKPPVEALEQMAESWQTAMDIMAASVD